MPNFTRVEGKDVGDIKVYALSTCGWCKKAKAYLKSNNISYLYIDLDTLPDEDMEIIRKEQKRFNPSGSFPTIVIDNYKTIVGYDEEELNRLIGGSNG